MLCHDGHKTHDRSHDIGGYNVYCPADAHTITPCPCGHVVVPCNITLGTCKRADGELYARWLQFGAISPILRTHCSHCDRRIWVYPEPQVMATIIAPSHPAVLHHGPWSMLLTWTG